MGVFFSVLFISLREEKVTRFILMKKISPFFIFLLLYWFIWQPGHACYISQGLTILISFPKHINILECISGITPVERGVLQTRSMHVVVSSRPTRLLVVLRCSAICTWTNKKKNTRQYDTSIGDLVFLEKIGQKENGRVENLFVSRWGICGGDGVDLRIYK